MLETATRTEGDAVVLSVTGDIDVQTAAELRDALADIADAGPSGDVVVDLGGVDFLDSSGLGVMVGAGKRLDAGTRRFSIVCDKPHLLRVFQITRLDTVLRIVPTLDAALR